MEYALVSLDRSGVIQFFLSPGLKGVFPTKGSKLLFCRTLLGKGWYDTDLFPSPVELVTWPLLDPQEP